MKVALDTNAYRALDDGHPKLAKLVRQAPDIALPITVLGELCFGFENGTRKQENVARLERFTASPRVQLLQVNEETAQIFGELAAVLEKLGKRMQQNDVWIAALCKQNGFVLATRDQGFKNIPGLETFDFENTD